MFDYYVSYANSILRGQLLVRVFVVYDSKYGNTKLAAENILDGIREVEAAEATSGYVKEVNVEKVADYDVIVLGGPNHMGRPSRTIKKFVDKLAELNLKAKYIAVFGTYAGRVRTDDRAVKKMERILAKKLPSLNLICPSLSVRVNGVTGPVVEGELPKCLAFGKKITTQF
jgi:flavorubredoxin